LRSLRIDDVEVEGVARNTSGTVVEEREDQEWWRRHSRFRYAGFVTQQITLSMWDWMDRLFRFKIHFFGELF